MKITKRQLRRIIKEAMHSDPGEEVRDILRHYDMIASDVGEIHVDDLIDHWVGQGNPSPDPGVRAGLVDKNSGNVYFGEKKPRSRRSRDSGGFGSGGAPATYGRRRNFDPDYRYETDLELEEFLDTFE